MDPRAPAPPTHPTADGRGVFVLVLLLGVGLQLVFWSRPVWPYRDQVELYELGWRWASEGGHQAFAKRATGGFALPGAALEWLVGAPLALWADARSPTLLLVAVHALAALLAGRAVASFAGWTGASLFLALFWLSPWRLYHSGFLWEPAYMLLPAAAHLWAARALAKTARAGPSVALGATLALAGQVHFSVVILAVATAVLAGDGRLRARWGAFAAGFAAGCLPLVPTLAAFLVDGLPGAEELEAPESHGLPGRFVGLARAALYWLRLGSLDVGRRFRQTVWCRLPGGDEPFDAWACAATRALEVAAVASVAIPLVAALWLFRQRAADPRLGWARAYALAVLVGMLFAAVASPILVQGWHLLVALPAACLAPTLWLQRHGRGGGPLLALAAALFVLLRLPAAALLAFGHPMYVAPSSEEIRRHLAPPAIRELFASD